MVSLEQLFAGTPWLVVDGARRVADVADRSRRVAGGMWERGVRPGDSVVFRSRNGLASVLTYRACWQLGARAVPLHHRLGPNEVDALVGEVAPALALRTDAEVDELGRAAALDDTTLATDPDADAVVLFTAGSTGRPKGVRHTHRSLVHKARLMADVHGLGRTDVVLMPAPLAHISGLLNGVLLPASTGMTTVLMDRWSPDEALALIERERVTYMVGPPTFFVDLMDAGSFSTDRVASLRLVSSGGAGVATRFVERATRELGALVKRSYGSTEAPTVATSTAGDDPAKAGTHDGHAIGDVELRLVDRELHVRGSELFAGYLDDRETAAVMDADGWFRTGDLAEITADGWLTIVGRVKDIVIRAGENISAREVEELLLEHPAVTDAVVIGVPHDRLGEQVVAAVVATGDFTVDDCRDWFGRHQIAPFKTPEVVTRLDQLPRLPTGKVDRELVRSMVRDRPDVS
jgi:cyclohexanecarboxylate-CoA ligase